MNQKNTLIISSIIIASLLTGCIAIRISNIKKEYKNSSFEIKEKPILPTFETMYNLHLEPINKKKNIYRNTFVIDENENGTYDKGERQVGMFHNKPFIINDKKSKIVYIEKEYSSPITEINILAYKNANDKKYDIINKPEDFYKLNKWKQNKSFNKANDLFKEQYIKQK